MNCSVGLCFQRARQRARQRDLQPIQNPGDSQRKHDAGVKAAPAQSVETRRNTGLDDAIVVPWRGSRWTDLRNNRRIAHDGHATLLRCLSFASPTELGAPQFNTELRCKSIRITRCEYARKYDVPGLCGSGNSSASHAGQRVWDMQGSRVAAKEPIGPAAVFGWKDMEWIMAERRKSAKRKASPARKKSAAPKTAKRWSQRVTHESDALDLKKGVFTLTDPKKIAASLKRSAEPVRAARPVPIARRSRC